MAKPKVRKLQALVKQYSKAFAPQQKLIKEDIAANEASGAAQEAGLQATAERSYDAIRQEAEDKGMSFSGFTPTEQAEYNATTYLPALANLQATIAGVRGGLLREGAGLTTQATQQALATREGDIAYRRSWVDERGRRHYESKEAAKQRQFQAGQAALDRSAAASNAAASRAAAAEQDKLPSKSQYLTQAFSGYKPAYEGGTAYYTEREIIPGLMATYNIPHAKAAKLAYDYRKRVFGEGSGR
jgi:hypothetical protein